jgi:hypothetical protein
LRIGAENAAAPWGGEVGNVRGNCFAENHGCAGINRRGAVDERAIR